MDKLNYMDHIIRTILERVKNSLRYIIREYKKSNLRRFLHWVKVGHFIRWMKIRRYSKKNQVVCLQIGGGRHSISDCINGDLIDGDIYLNAIYRLPFKNETIDFIFCEQFLEHLSLVEGKKLMAEIFRILKPGGVVRIATPSLNGLIDVYRNQNALVDQKEVIARHRRNHNPDCQNACHLLNDFFHLWGHKFIYDETTLAEIMTSTGFKNLVWQEFGKSEHHILMDRERHADIEWIKHAFTIICEATKAIEAR